MVVGCTAIESSLTNPGCVGLRWFLPTITLEECQRCARRVYTTPAPRRTALQVDDLWGFEWRSIDEKISGWGPVCNPRLRLTD